MPWSRSASPSRRRRRGRFLRAVHSHDSSRMSICFRQSWWQCGSADSWWCSSYGARAGGGFPQPCGKRCPYGKGAKWKRCAAWSAWLGIRKPIDLLLSPATLEPGIFGIVKPVLVWPKGISERLDDAQLEAILAHEVWHVRRRDNLAAAIHMVVEAIFWFHPLVWWLGSRLVDERERACDEEVLESGSDRQVYAESILKTCEFCVESPLACVSGVTGADLKKRIVRIMTERMANKLSFGRKLLLAGVGVAAVAGPVVFGLVNAPQIRAASATNDRGLCHRSRLPRSSRIVPERRDR